MWLDLARMLKNVTITVSTAFHCFNPSDICGLLQNISLRPVITFKTAEFKARLVSVVF
jgi:hypothetical protein